MNTGQICVSPDYVMVVRSEEQRLLKMLTQVNREFGSGDPRRVINSRHFDRLQRLLKDSEGSVVCGGPDAAAKDSGAFPATIVSRPSMNAPLMQEEVFGPIMSVHPVDSIDDAIARLRGQESPLALYVFTNNTATADRVVAGTQSGGVCINDTMVHLANPNLPFGGVGASGFGSYHGRWGFEEFSHKRSVMHKGLSVDVDRCGSPPALPVLACSHRTAPHHVASSNHCTRARAGARGYGF